MAGYASPLRARATPVRVAAVLLAFTLACDRTPPPAVWPGPATTVAPGVELFQSTDRSLVDAAGPVALSLLRLDPARVHLASALSNDEVVDAERVDAIATRHRAVAAINGGFFNVKNGEPTGLLKVRGELVSDSSLGRGAVVIWSPPSGKTELAFDQLSAKVALKFRAEGFDWVVPIDGVDTTRERGKVMLYTPAYHGDTDTATNGTEWIIRGGAKPVVTGIRKDSGRTPIPRDGAVLSFGGLELPDELGALDIGTRVTFETTWKSANGLHDRASRTRRPHRQRRGPAEAERRDADELADARTSRAGDLHQRAPPAHGHRGRSAGLHLAGGDRRPSVGLQHRHELRGLAAALRSTRAA